MMDTSTRFRNPFKKKGGNNTAEQMARSRLLRNENYTKLVLFLKDEPRSKRWETNVLAGFVPQAPPVVSVDCYSDPVVEAFFTYIAGVLRPDDGGAFRFEDLLSRSDFDPLAEFERFLDGYKAKLTLTANGPLLSHAPDHDLHTSARVFLKQLRSSNPNLTDRTAPGEAKRFLKPLIRMEFSRPKKPRKKKTPDTVLERLENLWYERAAKKFDYSVERVRNSKEVIRIEFSDWMEIVHTEPELSEAHKEKVKAVRDEVYAYRRKRFPAKKKRIKSTKTKR